MKLIEETKLEQFEGVRYRMNEEGFHYCFVHYSDFKEINDEKFHKLRKEYIEVAKKLKEYIDVIIQDELI